MPHAPLRIFISSTEKDLGAYRAKVVEAIRGLHQSADTFEVWDADERPTVQACKDAARTADLTIAIVAHRYGWKPTVDEGGDGATSITELEVQAAVASKATPSLRAFVVADDFKWDGAQDTAADDLAKLVEFKNSLHRWCTPRRFTTPDNLHAWVTQTLANWLLARRPADPAEKRAIDDYLKRYLADWRRLPLSVDRGRADARRDGKPRELDQVYVGLNVTQPRPVPDGDEGEVRGKHQRRDGIAPMDAGGRDGVPWTALEACAHHQTAVILGGPGAGKSSFLRMLAIELAKPFVGEAPTDDADATPLPFDRALMPVMVVVREFAAFLQGDEQAAIEKGDREGAPLADVRLTNFIKRSLEKRGLSVAFDPIERRLRDGDAILLLDGLDEIVHSERRAEVIAAIRAFARYFPETRMLVTCRVAAYTTHAGGDASTTGGDEPGHSDWHLPFPVVELAGFDQGQQARFIEGWYRQLGSTGSIERDPTDRSEQLVRALKRSDLRRMASNPLLLTLMAIVHERGDKLPDERTALYDKAVETLLWDWQQGRDPGHELDDGRGVLAMLQKARRPKSKSSLETRLHSLARAAHAGTADKGSDDVADISREQLMAELEKLHEDPIGRLEWVGGLIEALTQRSGLLVETRPRVFAFPHRTFQEYLAARAIASSKHPAQEAMAMRTAAGNLWREPILMMGGAFAHVIKLPEQGASLLRKLIREVRDGQSEAERRIEDLILAADLVCEMNPRWSDVEDGEELINELRGLLQTEMFDARHEVEDRARLGAALGRVGDPRAGVARERLSKQGVRYPEIEWSALIEPGPFPMGNDNPEAKYDDEIPRFTCTIIQPYRLSLYPVTVAQYRLFIAAGGYRPGVGDRFWTEQGRAWRSENGITGPRTDDLPEVFETPNHPQVRVSWHEATAFCRWLAEMSGQPIRLPTEMEWERAARHTDARLYPWGNAPSDAQVLERANVEQSIGHTTPVGLYVNGAAECKALDMAGNVWEWCQTVWRDNYAEYPRESALDNDENPSARVVRGGAWHGLHVFARCAFRFRFGPVSRLGDVGFRVCVCPFSPSDL